MSLIGGLVDSHHEMELNPSTQLVHSNWFVRHIGVILLAALVAAVVIAV